GRRCGVPRRRHSTVDESREQTPRLPETMHAVQLVEHGGLDQLVYRTDLPLPEPGPGELLVEVRAAGINNTDLNTRIGWYSGDGSWTGEALQLPRIQGADVCGVVAAVGPGAPGSRVGERVIVQACLRSLGSDGTAPWLG